MIASNGDNLIRIYLPFDTRIYYKHDTMLINRQLEDTKVAVKEKSGRIAERLSPDLHKNRFSIIECDLC